MITIKIEKERKMPALSPIIYQIKLDFYLEFI